MIVFPPLTRMSHIEKGTMLLINGSYGDGQLIQLYTIQSVKRTKIGGAEIVLDVKKNSFFYLDLYLDGKSWVRDAYIVIKDNNL